jgi:hypothetical protein
MMTLSSVARASLLSSDQDRFDKPHVFWEKGKTEIGFSAMVL